MKEIEFLESLFKCDGHGDELQFFKYSVYETKLKIYQRIMKLREIVENKEVEE